MKLQWETDYALRCVLCLAGKETEAEEWIRASELAGEIKVPVQMARKVLTRLCACGILEGKPGPKGGVRLAVKPEEISVLDVVRCVEGDLCINRCLGPDQYCSRDAVGNCGVHGYLLKLQQEIEKSMREMTFDRILTQEGTSKGKTPCGREKETGVKKAEESKAAKAEVKAVAAAVMRYGKGPETPVPEWARMG